MKYFRMSEWDIKWRMTWDNYMLYVASIPTFDTEEKTDEPEEKHAADIF